METATSVAQKPWKAEYAKSSRASCRTCSSPIAKDAFRLAKMLQSTQFDGFMAHWHHASCIFKKKKQVHDWNDVEGGDTLRWEDQQRLRKYIEGGPTKGDDEKEPGIKPAKGKGGKSSAKAKGGDEDGDGEYAIENAKSSRSTCKSCNEKIEKGQVRISIMTTAESGKFRGKVPQWRHAMCFLDMGDWTGPVADLPGWDTLSSEDQATVQALTKSSASGYQANCLLCSAYRGKQKETVKAEASEPKAGRGKKTEIEHDTADEKPSKRQRKKDGNEVTATVAADEKVVTKKMPKEKDTAPTVKQKDTELERKLEKQSKDLWAIKDKLRELVSTAQMRELLSVNGQDAAGSEYDLRERCADGMMFGPLEKCPLCEGFMEYQGGTYRCRGFLTAWSKCTFTTQRPKRSSTKWEIGKECDNDYLMQWFKTQSKKKGERLLVPASPAKPSSAHEPRKSGESFLEGCEFVIIGRLSVAQAKLKGQVELAGGRLRSGTTGIGSSVTCVVTTESTLETDKFRRDLGHAREVPIVKEQYLLDCLKKKEKLSMDAYKLELSLKPDIVKVKVKGRGSVHPDSGLQETGHIVEEGKVLYATTLNRTEISTGINSFYVLQLIEEDAKSKAHHLFRKWGRVGNDRIGNDKIERMSSKAAGINEFKRLFHEKTGNLFEQWVDHENFEKQPGKFHPLEIDYGVDETPSPQMALAGSKSKLHPRVLDLMKMLFDLETYKSAMREFEINMSEMPLGKLSKRHIERGYSVLTEIQNILGGAEQGPRQQGLLVDASNRFFTLIPTVHPLIISDEQTLKFKIDMLEALRDIEIAAEFLDTKDEDPEEDPLDAHYYKLHCDIKPLDHDSSDFKLVEKYLKQTHAPSHTDWALELEDVFAVDREGESESFTPFKRSLDNRMLLWHGSRTTNYVGILSQGLRIAPPEAPVSGYMFGKGLYFADLVSKSAQYCFTTKKNPTGLLLLSEVALGKTNNLTKAQYMEEPPPGTNSTLGLGKKKPLETAFEKFEGDVIVPCGKPVPSGVRSDLKYNEYIVYDKAQVKLRFLLKVNFKHKH